MSPVVKRSIGAVLFVAFLGSIFMAVYRHGYYFVYNVSDSFPKRIYLAHHGIPAEIGQGNIVVFTVSMPETDYAALVAGRSLFKKVACAPGDHLERIGDRFICNGTEIAHVRPTDSQGRAVTVRFDFNGTVPADRYFVTAPHPQSFDSRYFGLIPKEAITGEVLCGVY